MHARTLLAWIAVGLVGLALAAGVTYAATQLSSQRIGLSAEPPSAGEELAPPARVRAHRRTNPTRPPRTTGTTAGSGGSTAGEPAGDDRGGHSDSSEERGEGSHASGDLDD